MDHPRLSVEFPLTLSTGATVFVRAEVGELVIITEVWSGEHEKDIPLTYESFSVKDRVAMDEAATDAYWSEVDQRRRA